MKKEVKSMATYFEQIVMLEQSETKEFIKKQEKRLKNLKDIQKRQEEGKKIQKQRVINQLKSSGILDDSGELAKPYSNR